MLNMIKLKFIVDECVGFLVFNWLIKQGFDAISISNEMPGIKDKAIVNKAFNEDRVVITLDKDFGDIVFKEKEAHCGVILLRLQSKSAEAKVKALENLFKNYPDELFGSFIVVSDSGVRVIKQTFN